MDDNNNNNTSDTQVISSQNTSIVSLFGASAGLSPSQLDYELKRLQEYYKVTSERQKEIIIEKFKEVITKINPTLVYLLLAIFSLILGVKLVNQAPGGGSKKSKKSRKSRK
jgi:hypothetical protein